MDKPSMIRTALSDTIAISGEQSLSERPLNGKINLRGDPDNPAFVKGVEKTSGLTLPVKPNTVFCADEKSAFWLGPNEWLLHVPLETVPATVTALHEALSGSHYAVTEVSDYFSVIRLSGPLARQVIASASPFDTREQNFQPGQCAQTRFGHASILVWPEIPDPSDNTGPSYGLQVRWSYAQYVYDYLVQSIQYAESVQAFVAAQQDVP